MRAFTQSLRAGFTITEMSIALVVIGLTIGGVMAGRSLMEAAAIQRMHASTNELITAISMFQNKYNALPGDMKNGFDMFGAAACGSNDPAFCNGNGDHLLRDNGGNAEYMIAYRHLSAVHLLRFTVGPLSTNYPYYSDPDVAPTAKDLLDVYVASAGVRNAALMLTPEALGGAKCPVDGNTVRVSFQLGTDLYSKYYDQFRDGLLTISEATAYDSKFDDGQLSSGSILIVEGLTRVMGYPVCANSVPDVDGCIILYCF